MCVLPTQGEVLSHVISKDGVTADPEKTSAIQEMEVPQSVSDLRRFLGMVNHVEEWYEGLVV